MSSLGSPNPFFIAGKKAYEVERSLRFNSGDSTYLSRTPSSAGNRRTWTISLWFKTEGGGSLQSQRFWSVSSSLTDGAYASFAYNNDGFIAELRSHLDLRTTGVFRDPSAWYHVVLALDTTQSTASDRAKLYVNGTQVTDFGTASYPSQNHEGGWNSTTEHNIGRELYGTRRYFGGYMAEFNNIDGLQLDPSYFGETNATTGQWNPKKYTGSYGTNGFYLDFSDNSGTTATTLGKDSSGNGNNFTPSGFSVSAGEGNDSLEDTPTLNYPTLNPLDMGSTTASHLVFSNGNLQVKAASGVWASTRATFAVSSGKWYWEVKCVSSASLRPFIGIIQSEVRLASNQTEQSNELGPSSTGIAYWSGQSNVRGGANTSGTSTNVPSCTSGDIVGVALDMDNKKVFFSKNGTFFASQDPANSSGELVSFSTTMQNATIAPAIQTYNNTSEAAINFGQRPFSYTPPTGFKKLNSANLSDPTIKLPNNHFNTLLYTGNGGTNNITGLSFEPDWVWMKNRSATSDHILCDQIRGLFNLRSNQTTAEQSNGSIHLQSFNSDGFTVAGTGSNSNSNGDSFVAWNWNAGGSTVTNNDGSISSQVRANTSAGFSIVTYTGTASNATVGHGLGVKPDCVILKRRTGGDSDWFVFHKDIGNTKNLRLNLSNSQYTTSNIWNNTDPTSSAVNIGTSSGVNGNGSTYVFYAFSEVAGYSKFGSYTGNNSTDGPFVFTGFRPGWVLIKSTGGSTNWELRDNKRDPDNPTNHYISPNLNGAEGTTSNHLDLLSNGFKVRVSGNDSWNNSGQTYIYLAFAESPFKNARAR